MTVDISRRAALVGSSVAWLALVIPLAGCSPAATTQASAPPSASAAAPVEAASFQRRRTLVDVKTLSLDELIERAARIFVGRINTVEEQDVPLRDGGTAKGRVVSIAVEQSLKGPVAAGESLTIRQALSISSPLKAGEKILWFLPQEGRSGLVQPLGIYSGDFRIDTQKQDSPATNLKMNHGLWRTTLAAEGFTTSELMSEAKELKLSSDAVLRMPKAAAEKPTADAVPLSLLIAAIRSKAKP